MSDSEDDSNIPSADECNQRCRHFVDVTQTDSALAMFYLQPNNWDVDKALNAYFADNGSTGQSKANQISTAEIDAENKAKTVGTSQEDKEPYRIRLMSWNIDGLDRQNLRSRTHGVCAVINKETPHIVFLQEVVSESQAILETECPTYSIIPGADDGYFVAIMVHVMFVKLEDTVILPFETSKMSRNILTLKCEMKGEKFYFMTSHLESTKDHSRERKSQLQKALGHMHTIDPVRTVIFGGDLNLRDKELQQIGGLPANVYDMWEITGKRPEAEFTWDVGRNDNLEWSFPYKPKCRFDRLYVKYAEKTPVKVEYFELIGLERLKSCQRFPSDHWGLLSHLNIVRKVPK